jgi:hypothetical protein
MSTYSFRFHGLGNFTLAYDDAYLQPGYGSPRLSLRFDVAAGWLDPDANHLEPILITGDIWLASVGLRPLPGFRPLLITAHGSRCRSTSTLTSPTTS